jgi:hypothetical protein
MCIVVRAESGDESWWGHRSIETLAFHCAQRRVNILLLVLMENDKPGNYLHVLHPGNSTCELTSPWIGDEIGGLAYHPEENKDSGKNSVLQQVYGNMFRYEGGRGLYQVQELNPYESLYGLEKPCKVTIWPDEERHLWTAAEAADGGVRRIEVRTQKHKESFAPFTIWRLGPFKSTGLILASFALSFAGATFDVLVGEREYFSVDGPRRLRCKTRYDCIRRMPTAEQSTWEQHLESFDQYVDFKSSYDVIIRKSKEADGSRIEVDEAGSCMIAEAPKDRQPGDKESATRYVTMDSDFKLNLHFAGAKVETERRSPDVLLGGLT